MRIGIDLGTTTTTVVRLDPAGKPLNPFFTPSLIAYREGTFFYGEDAHSEIQIGPKPAHPIRDLKLKLGEKGIKGAGQSLKVEDIVSGFLCYLADKVTGGAAEVEEAVIGTPVNVSESHRSALLRSAAQAGFKKTRLVYEPTAALVGAMDPASMARYGTVLVVDWGGGTLDLSLVVKEGGSLREIAVDGDVSRLGGSMMDARIAHKMLERSPTHKRRIAEIPDGLEMLKVDIEQEKQELLESFSLEDDEIELTPFWLDSSIVLKGSDVLHVLSDMADEAASQIVNFIDRSGLAVSGISYVLFAGGVCKSQLVRDRIQSVLPNVNVISSSMPQQLTGYGCARLLSYGYELRLAADFGVRQSDESFCCLLPAGHDIGMGCYRRADFMVSDPTASEACFDFGIIAQKDKGSKGMTGSTSDGFVSLKMVMLRCQSFDGQLVGAINHYECVRVFLGVNEAMAVIVYAESNIAGASVDDRISGIPFAIRIGGLT